MKKNYSRGTGITELFGPSLGRGEFGYSKGLGKNKEGSVKSFIGKIDNCCIEVKTYPTIAGINVGVKLLVCKLILLLCRLTSSGCLFLDVIELNIAEVGGFLSVNKEISIIL